MVDIDELKRLAQPAEAEGAELPGMWDESDLSGGQSDSEDTSNSIKRHTPISQGDHIPSMNPCDHGGWVRCVDHLAALSAVTAERDRLDAECGRLLEGKIQDAETIYLLEAERDQLRAEVEALRMLAAECNDYLNFNELTNIAHGSILHRKLADAAMAAKEGE